MHSSLFITKSEEVSQRVYCVILEGRHPADYNVTKGDKYKSDWS